MKWFGKGEDENKRFLGLPLSKLWEGQADAILDTFEPENPNLFVPRHYGLGWSLNLGAVAVKAGWIRPDDSLPDLSNFIPTSMRQSVSLAQIASALAVLASAVKVAQHESVPTSWTLGGLPKKFFRGKNVAFAALLTTGAVATLPRLIARHETESRVAINLGHHADLLGFTSMVTVGLIAANRSATHPGQRQFLPIAAPLLAAVISASIKLAYLKVALRNIDKQLQAKTGKND
ncbi:DUF5808 domain-containing protein [Arcanobacterium phocae]|uniref:DUF5808 domain-containing protein n=1 Tax=Arcanobacterium phocae TaxID=131112 RepID=UPI001C0EA2A0|nr:DUF5808 domain-containing protein [Arcanobacterium phocae]